jgi:hypothetical protein
MTTVERGRTATWEDVVAAGCALPEVEPTTWHDTPALQVRDRALARLRTESDGLVLVMCTLAGKEALLAEGGPVFSTTADYDGYGGVLVDLLHVDRARLAELVEDAWRLKAPPDVVSAFGFVPLTCPG